MFLGQVKKAWLTLDDRMVLVVINDSFVSYVSVRIHLRVRVCVCSAIEKENKKCRDVARRKYQEKVRALVAFVHRRGNNTWIYVWRIYNLIHPTPPRHRPARAADRTAQPRQESRRRGPSQVLKLTD